MDKSSLVATPVEVQIQLIMATPMEVQIIYLVEQTEGELDERRRMTSMHCEECTVLPRMESILSTTINTNVRNKTPTSITQIK